MVVGDWSTHMWKALSQNLKLHLGNDFEFVESISSTKCLKRKWRGKFHKPKKYKNQSKWTENTVLNKTTLINFVNFLKVVVLLFLSVLLMTVDISKGFLWSRCKRCIFRCQKNYIFCKAKILDDYCGINREACWKRCGKCWKQGYCVPQQTIMGLVVIINLAVYLTSPDLLRLNKNIKA